MESLTPKLELETHFVLDSKGRIVSTRESRPARAPLLSVIRGASACAWAIRHDVPDDVAEALTRLLEQEPPMAGQDSHPVHFATYLSLTGGQPGFNGPAFAFPRELPPAPEVIEIHDENELRSHFGGWIPGEIAEGRAPVLGMLHGGHPVSICFSARSAPHAAAAGLETFFPFRGRGFAPQVTAAWATAVRAGGRVPLYSTSRDNAASLSVARKLGLVPYAVFWSIDDPEPARDCSSLAGSNVAISR